MCKLIDFIMYILTLHYSYQQKGKNNIHSVMMITCSIIDGQLVRNINNVNEYVEYAHISYICYIYFQDYYFFINIAIF